MRRAENFILMTAFVTVGAAGLRSGTGLAQSLPPNSNVTTESSRKCAAQLSAFVEELDKLLASNPRSTTPVSDLLHKYHPFEKCDTEEAVKIMRRSRFSVEVSENREAYVFGFVSAGDGRGHGVYAQISIEKATGNSRLPFVIMHGYL